MSTGPGPGDPGGGVHVLLDARLRPGEQGGVEQATIGMAAGLSALDGPDRFTFLVQGDGAWLAPQVRGPCRIVATRFPGAGQRRVLALADRVGGRSARDAARVLLEAGPGPLPRPDPVVRALRPDVVHFLKHRGWRTSLPNAYVPHDLQHVAMPEHFSATTRAYRRVVYGAMARQASVLVALTEAQRPLLAAHYRVPPDRVVAIGWGAALAAYAAPAAPVAGLPARFVLLPAKTWPHKRHDLLIEAVARLHAEGVEVPVVLTGGRTPLWADLEALAVRRGVDHLLTHLGYVGDGELRTLYARATAVVLPSDHEGFGIPAVDAMAAGTAVVCSDIPAFATTTGDAALRFPPGDAAGLAAALSTAWRDDARREALVAAGRRRAEGFTWAAVAERYLALYRRLAASAASRA